MTRTRRLTLTHWGAYRVDEDGTRLSVHPFELDPDPSPIGIPHADGLHPRIDRPYARRGWLDHGPGPASGRRGTDDFVALDWEEALDRAAAELDRVRSEHGNEAIYGGSYGWSSAGRFHHAQTHLRRFLTLIGGYTDKINTYSHAAGEVLIPHVLGMTYDDLSRSLTPLELVGEHADLVIAFGGIPLRTAQIQSGGVSRHLTRSLLEGAAAGGVRFVNVSPVRDDLPHEVGSDWLPCRPGSDTAVVLGMLHVLATEDLADRAFLDRYTVGWDQLEAYVLGFSDGVPKTPAWAAGLSGIPEGRITTLAREAAEARTMVTGALALQRQRYGEQPWWAIIALAAALGQIGTPGGGFGLGYGAFAWVGNGIPRTELPKPAPTGVNPVPHRIPVARITDLLLSPGAAYDYDGSTSTYPDIRLVYWAGGNPFHHQQDVNRLHRAWQRPDTVIVNEPFWTATARRADIVFPATTTLERVDIGGAPADEYLFAMTPVGSRCGEARDDYDIFAALADRLGVAEAFTGGRTAEAWVEHLYDEYAAQHPAPPTYAAFVERGYLRHPVRTGGPPLEPLLAAFVQDPFGSPLATPSGRIELFSERIAGFGYDDCPGHPTWLEPDEWLGNTDRFPLHLISNQPADRLHSQPALGPAGVEHGPNGSSVLRMSSDDADDRRISEGDVVVIFNGRGSVHAKVTLDESIRPGVVVLPTGAWFDPVDPDDPASPCARGNPNVLTRDVGTSSLSQGSSAQTCLVEVARSDQPAP